MRRGLLPLGVIGHQRPVTMTTESDAPERQRTVPWANLAGVVFDMDGVLWRGETPLPGLSAVFERLAARGLRFVLATNNASKRPGDYVLRMAGYGVLLEQDQVLTSGMAAAEDLKRRHAPGVDVYVIGESGLNEALEEAGFRVATDALRDVAAVVVGFDRSLTYAKLRDAAVLLQRGAEFVATNTDASFPVEGAVHPGAGATVVALSATTGMSPRVVGKPEPPLFAMATDALRATPDRVLVVGDRLDTDIAGAVRAGMWSVLVTTGIDTEATMSASPWRPDVVLSGLDELAAVL